jgi:hypothetical protein
MDCCAAPTRKPRECIINNNYLKLTCPKWYGSSTTAEKDITGGSKPPFTGGF